MTTKPFIVAELSGNHNGDINRAIKLIKAAHDVGADAVKLQTYTADTITLDNDSPDFIVQGGLWNNYKLYDLYKQAHTPWEWHEKLFSFAKDLGITIFSSPFDETAVDFLEELNCPIYKIASFEITHHALLKHVGNTGKPVIMSTGMASLQEIDEAVNVLLQNNCSDLTLLHCVSAYPAPIEDTNLNTMIDLKKRFAGIKVGLSDHSLGTVVAVAAVTLGAEVIEKHLTLARADEGVDSAFSLEPEEFKILCRDVEIAYKALGQAGYTRSENEQKNKMFRRSIFASQSIKKGDIFSPENIKVIRPSTGLDPRYYSRLIGGVAKLDYISGDPLSIKEMGD